MVEPGALMDDVFDRSSAGSNVLEGRRKGGREGGREI